MMLFSCQRSFTQYDIARKKVQNSVTAKMYLSIKVIYLTFPLANVHVWQFWCFYENLNNWSEISYYVARLKYLSHNWRMENGKLAFWWSVSCYFYSTCSDAGRSWTGWSWLGLHVACPLFRLSMFLHCRRKLDCACRWVQSQNQSSTDKAFFGPIPMFFIADNRYFCITQTTVQRHQSRCHGVFGGRSLPKQSSNPPKLKHETL